eukprot:SM000011S19045  [mRNA]  locus=s11:484818:497597:- [translate_table: standard]
MSSRRRSPTGWPGAGGAATAGLYFLIVVSCTRPGAGNAVTQGALRHQQIAVLFSSMSPCLLPAATGLLPFRILSIEPTPTNDMSRPKLDGLTPITMTFTKAALALGADHSSSGGQQPFHLSEPIAGKFHWVSTSVYRFDPDETWPPDLTVALNLCRNYTSFDGSELDTVGLWDHKLILHTRPLKISVATVLSTSATNFTGGMWSSQHCYNGRHEELSGTHEVPPDGRIVLTFSSAVNIGRVQEALRWGSEYNLTFAEGARLHPLGGPMSTPFTVKITGLCRFFIPLSKETRQLRDISGRYSFSRKMRRRLSYYNTVFYRRLVLNLPHGLGTAVTRRALREAFVVQEKLFVRNTSLVTDGYGQPLESSSIIFNMGNASLLFKDAGNNPQFSWGGYVAEHGALLEEGTGWDGTWPICTQRPEEFRATSSIKEQLPSDTYLSLLSVRAWNIESNISTLRKWSLDPGLHEWHTMGASRHPPDLSVDLMSEEAMQIAPVNASRLLRTSGLFTLQMLEQDIVEENVVDNRLHTIGETGLGASYFFDDRDVHFWVVDLKTGSPIRGAQVHLIKLQHNSWEYNRGQNMSRRSTDEEGLATFKLPECSESSYCAYILHDMKAITLSIHLPMPYQCLDQHGETDRHTAVLILDRLMYYANESLMVKGYVHQVKHSELQLSSLTANFYVGVRPSTTFKWHPVVLDPVYGSFSEEFHIPAGTTPGSYVMELVRTPEATAMEPSMQPATWQEPQYSREDVEEEMRGSDSQEDDRLNWRTAAYEQRMGNTTGATAELQAGQDSSILDDHLLVRLTSTVFHVLGEQAPVVMLDLVADQVVAIPGECLNFTAKIRTYTGAPVAGAMIQVDWEVTIAPSSQQDTAMEDRPLITFMEGDCAAKESDNKTSTNSGSASMASTAEGLAVFRLHIASQELTQQSLWLTATVVGPSGEMVVRNLYIPIAKSKLSLTLLLTQSFPLPGQHFGVQVLLERALTNRSLLVEDAYSPVVTMTLLVNRTGKNGMSQLKEVSTCLTNATTLDPLSRLQESGHHHAGSLCSFQMRKMAQYLLRGCLNDASGVEICSALQLGSSKQQWKDCPLSRHGRFISTLDKEEYSMGDTAVVSFDTPYINAWALAMWGPTHGQQMKTFQLHGFPRTSISITIGDECREGCALQILVAVPRQKSTLLSNRLATIPSSATFDINAPTTHSMFLILPIRQIDGALDVDLSVPEGELLPDTEVTVDIGISCRGLPESDVELTVVAVDKATLGTAQSPLQERLDTASVSNGRMYEALVVSTQEHLLAPKYLQTVVKKFEQLKNLEPGLVVQDLCRGNNLLEPFRADFCHKRVIDMDVNEALMQFTSSLSADLTRSRDAFGVADAIFNRGNSAKWADEKMYHFNDGITLIQDENDDVLFRRRTHFNSTILFATQVVSDKLGKVAVTFQLPANVRSIAIHAYAATEDHRFASAEAQMVVRRSIALRASAPKLVRLGDVFEAGVNVRLDNHTPQKGVNVTIVLTTSGVSTVGDTTIFKYILGPATGEAVFHLSARAVGVAVLHFKAVVGHEVEDQVETIVQVEALHENVMLFSSFVMSAGKERQEDLEIPPALPDSGRMIIRAGIGRQPAIDAIAQMLDLHAPVQNCISHEWLIAKLAASLSTSEYLQGSSLLQLDVPEETSSNLSDLVASGSLCWSSSPCDLGFQAVALFLLRLLEHLNCPLLSPSLNEYLQRTWHKGLVKSLETCYKGQGTMRIPLLAEARLALGTSWVSKRRRDRSLRRDLGMSRLLQHVSQLSNFHKAALGLTLSASLDDFYSSFWASELANIITSLRAAVRIQGSTAYITEGSNQPASRSANAMALLLFTKAKLSFVLRAPCMLKSCTEATKFEASLRSCLVLLSVIRLNGTGVIEEKIANYLSAYSSLGGQNLGIYSVSPREAALPIIALAQYDRWKGSVSTDLQLEAAVGKKKLLTASFRLGGSSSLVHRSFSFQEVGSARPSIKYQAHGKGEVYVTTTVSYVPLKLITFPLFRGLDVRRVIQKIDISTGENNLEDLTWVEVGSVLQVTLQMTTLDDIEGLQLVDKLPGGCEPLSYYGASDAPDLLSGSYAKGFTEPWYDEQQKTMSAVRVSSGFLKAGTYTYSYKVLATTVGHFSLPPCQASVKGQPEVMGLAPGGQFWIVPMQTRPSSPPTSRLFLVPYLCPHGCSGHGVCNGLTNKCICDKFFQGADCATLQKPSLMMRLLTRDNLDMSGLKEGGHDEEIYHFMIFSSGMVVILAAYLFYKGTKQAWRIWRKRTALRSQRTRTLR